MDAKYDVEISGSIPVKRAANNFAELRKIASRALGRISVCNAEVEVFFGSGRELLDALEIAEEAGETELRDIRS